jgi:hypothetical protein
MAFMLVSGTALAYTTFGAPDCSQWLNQKLPADRSWLLGFLSGQNSVLVALEKPDLLSELSSTEQVYSWMDIYCRANPGKTVADGATEYYLELSKKKEPSGIRNRASAG